MIKINSHFFSKTKKIVIPIFIITLMLISIFAVKDVSATMVFQDGFRTGNFSQWTGTHTSNSGTATVSNVRSYDSDGFSFKSSCPTYGSGGTASFAYQTIGNGYNVIGVAAGIYWSAGSPTPLSSYVSGSVLFGVGTSSGASVGVNLFDNGSGVKVGVRYSDGVTGWTNVLSSYTMPLYTWVGISLLVTSQSSIGVYDGSIKVYSPTNILILDIEGASLLTTNYDTAIFGNSWNSPAGVEFYLDDATVGSSFVGVSTGSGGTGVYFLSNTIVAYETAGNLLYTGFDSYNNYNHLFTVQSHGVNNITDYNPDGVKYQSAILNHSQWELFAPFMANGHIFIVGNTLTHASITILNETTLAEMNYYELPYSQATYFINTVYDSTNDLFLFGMDTATERLQITAVPVGSELDNSKYFQINIGQNPDYSVSQSAETFPITFKGYIYISVTTGDFGGASGLIRSRLYQEGIYWNRAIGISKPDINVWTIVKEVTGINISPSGYFAHIGSTNGYLVWGVASNYGTTSTTMRLEYTPDGSHFTEKDTGVPESYGEDHLNINGLDGDRMFLIETAARYSTNLHLVYMFNAHDGTLTYSFTVKKPNNASAFGSGDRPAGYFPSNNVVYISAYEIDNPSTNSAEIIKIQFTFPVVQPDYMTYIPVPIYPYPTSTPIIPPIIIFPEIPQQFMSAIVMFGILALIFICGGLGWYTMKSGFGGLVGINLGIILGYAIPIQFGYTFIPLWAVIVIIVVDAIYAARGSITGDRN